MLITVTLVIIYRLIQLPSKNTMLINNEVSFSKQVKSAQFGSWILTTEDQSLMDDKNNRQLEPLLYNILVYLITNSERIISRQELVDNVWKQNYVDDNAINRAMSELRKALKSESQRGHVVKTHYRSGYSFLLPVTIEYRQDQNKKDTPETSVPEKVTAKPRTKTPYLLPLKMVLLSFIIAICLIGAFRFLPGESEEIAATSKTHKQITFSEEILTWEKGNAVAPLLSKDQIYLAYTHNKPSKEEYSLSVKDMNSLKDYRIFTSSNFLIPIAWSSNDTLIYQIPRSKLNKTCEVWKLTFETDVKNISHTKLFNCDTGELISGAISAEDNQFIYTKYNYRNIPYLTAIVSKDLITGAEFQISSPNNEEKGDYFVSLSNSEKQVAFLRLQPFGTEVFVANKDGSEQRKVFQANYRINSVAWELTDKRLIWFNNGESELVELDLENNNANSTIVNSYYDLNRRFFSNIISRDRVILATNALNRNIDEVIIEGDALSIKDYLDSDENEDDIVPLNLSSKSIYVFGNTKKSLWMIQDGIRKKLFNLDTNTIIGVAVSPTDEQVVVASKDKLYLYSLKNDFNKIKEIPLEGSIKSISWPKNNKLLITYAKSVKTFAWFYNIDTEQLIKLTNIQTHSARFKNGNLYYFNENFELIKKDLNTKDVVKVIKLPKARDMSWEINDTHIYYAKNRFSKFLYKQSLTDTNQLNLFELPQDRAIVNIAINKDNKIYLMYEQYRNNYLLDLKSDILE